ncbi:3-methyladenine DNA glycosylase AlkD [Neomicrococcus aestuarii]|uniref:3-methyladenine DNA glycosylase AlkD n=1 Tax=Neomicrococcus aestuarii TaxID=556325 RepID=A0A7W8WZA7_9MICC|nr:DNA alkylation repair protein [Neomicrococcus aestuarii]MBB5512077.1 3-methyladenine DNA glycosylase AlkD [Neomicrococcus aestuarii]
MTPAASELISEQFFRRATEEHLAVADPARALKMQAYLKSEIPHFGVPRAQSRKINVTLAAEILNADNRSEDAATRLETSRYAWDHFTHRDHRYAAQDILDVRSIRGNIDVLPLLTHMVDTGQWWDLIDGIQRQYAALLVNHRQEIAELLLTWATHENKWRRRTAIIAQLNLKAETDTTLLTTVIERNASHPDFFVRKAIGWALREYAKTDEQWVRDFLGTHSGDLSSLSIREASKHLLNSKHE